MFFRKIYCRIQQSLCHRKNTGKTAICAVMAGNEAPTGFSRMRARTSLVQRAMKDYNWVSAGKNKEEFHVPEPDFHGVSPSG
jgi:hypothetical protein